MGADATVLAVSAAASVALEEQLAVVSTEAKSLRSKNDLLEKQCTILDEARLVSEEKYKRLRQEVRVVPKL